jgi:hypothetical protein
VLLTFHNSLMAGPGQLIFDASGDLYSAALGGSFDSNCLAVGCGLIFELTPGAKGRWTENTVYDFCSVSGCQDGDYPSGVILGRDRNLYGSSYLGGDINKCAPYGCGTIFEIKP